MKQKRGYVKIGVLFLFLILFNLFNISANVNLTSPEKNASYRFNQTIPINFSIDHFIDINSSCYYSINDGVNISLINCSNSSFIILSNGSYNFSIFINEINSEFYSDNSNFDVINANPIIDLISPFEGASYGDNNSILLNFSVYDIDYNLDNCWYNIDNGNNISLTNCRNSSFNVPVSNDYQINIYANDSMGYLTNDSVNFNVNIGAPTIIIYTPFDIFYSNKTLIEFNFSSIDNSSSIISAAD